MKKLIFLLTGLFTQILPQSGWIEIYNLPILRNFKSVRFVDSTTGWIAGEFGSIIATTNGGAGWAIQTSGTLKHLNCVYFTDHLFGWAVGDSGIVLQTSDGGANWVESSFITKQKLRTVFFVDINNGWIAGDSGVVFKTTNNGLNWINCSIGTLYAINSIFFNDLNNGWLVNITTIWRTTNSGLDWISNASITGLNSIYFSNLNTGWAVGARYISGLDIGIIYKTSNGGQSWLLQKYQPTDYYYSVYAHDSNKAWVAINGGILKTTDGGVNWLLKRLSFNNLFYNIYSVCFSDLLHGWAVGGGGAVFKTTDGGIVFIEDETPLIEPTSFRLDQNYPNPFNPTTTINYQIKEDGLVTLKLYDILGSEVRTLVNEDKTKGRYAHNFNGSDLASGIYIYVLKAGDVLLKQKMVLAK